MFLYNLLKAYFELKIRAMLSLRNLLRRGYDSGVSLPPIFAYAGRKRWHEK